MIYRHPKSAGYNRGGRRRKAKRDVPAGTQNAILRQAGLK